MKIGFYLLGEKAYRVLNTYLSVYDSNSISLVVIAKDSGVDNDFSKEIELLCLKNRIPFRYRCEQNIEPEGLRFAIGWKWIINNTNDLLILHDSILPKYRGFSPLVNMLINKEPQIGVTCILASEKYDEGDIIGCEKVNINYPIKIQDAINRISVLYGNLVLNVVSDFNRVGSLVSEPQSHNEATYSIWRDEDDYFIDWSRSADYISRFIDSVSFPFKGAATYIGEKKYRIHDALKVVEDKVVINRVDNIGKVISFDDGYPVVICGEGLLSIRKIMDYDNEVLNSNINFRSKFSRC